MDYQIKKYNGTVYANIPNNVIFGPNQASQSTPINLVGRNKVSYGQALNENFLWLTENFAGTTAPTAGIPGQLWYNYTTSTGQLLISVVNSPRQPDPSNPDTDTDWASIPMIANFNTMPDSQSSVMGRMVLTNNADSLRVLMKNKEWREIQTTRPVNKEYESLLDIFYDTGKNYITFTSSSNTKTISILNSGAASTTDTNGFMTFINGDGVMQFGSNYFYELKILGRVVSDSTGTLISVPTSYKTWLVKGTFYINNAGSIVPGTTLVTNIPDPRQISYLSSNIDVIDQSSDAATWNLNIIANGVDPNISIPTGTTVADYKSYVQATLNSTKHYGLGVQCSISGLSSGQVLETQFSVYAKIIGIPTLGV